MPLILPNDFVNDTTADAAPVQQNYSTIEQYMNANVVTRDGNVAMDAPLLLSGAPTQPNHASTKAYVDAASTTLDASTKKYIDDRLPRLHMNFGIAVVINAADANPTSQVACTVTVPAHPVTGHVFVTGMLRMGYATHPAGVALAFCDIIVAGASGPFAQDYPCIPPAGADQYHAVLTGSHLELPANTPLTLQLRLGRYSGTVVMNTFLGGAYNRIDAIWMQA